MHKYIFKNIRKVLFWGFLIFIFYFFYLFFSVLFGCPSAENKGNLGHGYHKNIFGEIYVYYNWGSDNCDLSRFKLETVDKKTFEVLNHRYTKDRNNVYYFAYLVEPSMSIVMGADAATFEVLNDRYARDKNNCYKFGAPIACEDIEE